jgi:hypothetical protein
MVGHRQEVVALRSQRRQQGEKVMKLAVAFGANLAHAVNEGVQRTTAMVPRMDQARKTIVYMHSSVASSSSREKTMPGRTTKPAYRLLAYTGRLKGAWLASIASPVALPTLFMSAGLLWKSGTAAPQQTAATPDMHCTTTEKMVAILRSAGGNHGRYG